MIIIPTKILNIRIWNWKKKKKTNQSLLGQINQLKENLKGLESIKDKYDNTFNDLCISNLERNDIKKSLNSKTEELNRANINLNQIKKRIRRNESFTFFSLISSGRTKSRAYKC